MEQAIFERTEGALAFADGRATNEVAMATDVPTLLARYGVMHPLVVSRSGLARSGVDAEMARRSMPYVQFADFTPNPTAEQVLAGLAVYEGEGCDGILSIGGGSAIDLAKAIKALGGCAPSAALEARLKAPQPMDAVHVALPTTAGTGSESTHFATIYLDGKKYSVADAALLPEAAILDASQLASLPQAERAATFLDALCHAIESYWSRRSSAASRAYSETAIGLLMANSTAYLQGDAAAAGAVMAAANLAGRAINLTTTTAAHAMCYQLTLRYGLSHGHAAAVCLPAAWRYLLAHAADDGELAARLADLSHVVCGEEAAAEDGCRAFEALLAQAALDESWLPTDAGELDVLAASVNVQRLQNFPAELTTADLRELYRQTLRMA